MLGTKILEEKKSKFNGELRVVKTLGMGTYIQANGLTQSGGIVESIWKQTFKQINHLTIQPFNNILVLGLGGGTVAKLLRKKFPEAKITGIDIDPVIVKLGKKYLGLSETNVKVKIGDALEIVKRLKVKGKRFDLVIVDLYQGDQFPIEFESEYYIQLTRTVLQSGGIVVFNRLYYGEKRPQAVKFGNKLEKIFSKVKWFYPEANLMFLCSK